MKIKNVLKQVSAVVATTAVLATSAHAAGTDVSKITEAVDLSGAAAGILAIGVAIGGLVAVGIAVRHVLGMMKRL